MKKFWKIFKLSLSKNSKKEKKNIFFAKTFEDLVFICFKHVSTQCPYQWIQSSGKMDTYIPTPGLGRVKVNHIL